ncbi:MAG: hypothetical protein NTV34_05900 [Proteobacteria bacterium]|nr:hypothetical protein [Pseudomonadota bacterium]
MRKSVLVLASLAMVSIGVSDAARAEENSCVLLQRLAANLGCVGVSVPGIAEKAFSDETMTNTFGGDQCVIGKALDDAKSTQKKECQAWLAEQKRELGQRFVTGSCKPSCSPCPETMQKCSVHGEVRYRLDNRSK